ncbi:S9 family peptidase [Gemmatimonas sp.]|jgi:dipeptidyl aminopeptidase/acylaminoacyl peptidase|uniref:S9 family peptidase n=1 Tax=Gemmatimonas sp. TaxID=1962908 RepID=UPI0037BFD099
MPRPTSESLRSLALLGLLALPAAFPATARAQNQVSTNGAAAKGDLLAEEGYVTPPEAIAKLVTAPRDKNASFTSPSPGARQYFMRTLSDGLPSLKYVGKAHHNLGGLQIDQQGNRERALTMRSTAGIDVTEWATGKRIPVTIPVGARVGAPVWSPDGTQIAFFALYDDATQLYVADAATGKSRPVSPRTVLATTITQPEWTADGVSIVTVLVPDGRGPEPKEPVLASGPMVRLNESNKLKTRTYADLVMTPFEKELLTYHMNGQLAVVNTKTKAVRKIGAPGLIRSIDASPDAQYFKVTYVEKPFSYALPVVSYGARDVVLDASGAVVKEVAKRPLRESDDPSDPMAARGRASVDTSKRDIRFHPFAPGLLYTQVAPVAARGRAGAGNGAAPAAAAPAAPAAAPARADSATAARRNDRLMHWKAPFDSGSATVLYETANRITATRFNDAGTILFVTESGTAGTFEQAVFLTENNAKYTVVTPRRGADTTQVRGGFGGRQPDGLITRPGRKGVPVVMVSTDGKFVFRTGTAPDTAKVQNTWVEKIEIKTGSLSRMYESDGSIVETISAPLDDDFSKAVVQRESATLLPQSYVLTLATKDAKQLTQNVDLMPELSAAVKKNIVARRADGYTFNVKVTLPAGYKDGTRLPAMFWFYPYEYDNQAAYDRAATQNAQRDRRYATYGPRSLAFLVTQGYAVVEPDAPIFASEGQLPNDNYVADLRNNLSAVIDALDTLAIVDRHRLGLGGHSYGAFSTVNAMVHTPFFKAGIAGDGAYNRTLTPNGFQSERRDIWAGRQTYLDMSPFLYADQLNGALLMYHSTEDQNVGTDPINSTRMYHALMGLGKTTSLYMYPYEDHGPIAKETVLDQWGRWVAWLDKYVKNANAPKKPSAM